MIAAAAGYSLGQELWLVERCRVSLLVEGEDDFQLPTVDLPATVLGKVREFSSLVPDHVAGGRAQASEVVGSCTQTLGVSPRRRVRTLANEAVDVEHLPRVTNPAVPDHHDEAVELYATHPHLELMPGNSIEIIECPAPPT